MGRRILVIVNPAADAGRAARRVDRLRRTLSGLGLTAVFRESQSPGHAVALATEGAATREFDLIASAGGDGTAREVASGILSSPAPDTPLAALPLGTGNDFAHLVGTGQLEGAMNAVATGTPRSFDVIEVRCERGDEHLRTHALSFAAVGLAADVVRLTTPAVKRWFGPRFCYSIGFFRALAHYRPVAARVCCDDQEFRDEFVLVCAGNTSHAGGRVMHLSPGADPRDGWLNFSLIRATSRMEVALQFFRLLRGTHVRHRRATYLPGRQIAIAPSPPADVQVDGDLIGTTPACFRVLPAALQVVGPPAKP